MQKFGLETQIDIPIKLFSNHSERKTATQILQTIMQLTGYRSF